MLDVTLVAGGERTGGAYAVLDVRAPVGTILASHVALEQDAFLLLLEGELEITLPGERRTLRAGEHVSLVRGVPRRVAVLADARALVTLTPAGLERLADLARPPVPEPDDLAALLSVAGVSLLPRTWRT
jgi:quercetin dioxygenase-like cupin family protein